MLETIEIVNGVLSLIFVITSVSLCIQMILKYFEAKNINVLLAGISWIFICEIWLAVSISFLLVIFTGNNLPLEVFFIIGFVLLPLAVQMWMILMTNLMWKKNQKIILIIAGLILSGFETVFLYLVFNDISFLGETVGTFDVRYEPFMLIYLTVLLLILIFTGIKFSIESLRAENPEIRLKGKFLLLAFLSFVVGSFISMTSGESIIILVIAKIIIISSAFEFYCGFMMPDSIKAIFIKQD